MTVYNFDDVIYWSSQDCSNDGIFYIYFDETTNYLNGN